MEVRRKKLNYEKYGKLFYETLIKQRVSDFKLNEALELFNANHTDCSRITMIRLLNRMRIMGLLKKIGRRYYVKGVSKYKTYSKYITSNRSNKDIVRRELISVFNKYTNDGDVVVTLETEEFKFLSKLKHSIEAIVCEIDPRRVLLMYELNKNIHIVAGDVDEKIKRGIIPHKPAHYYLDYCDTIENHYETIEEIARKKRIADNKLFAITFALNRHISSIYNQVAEAIKNIQKIFIDNGMFAELVYARTYKDGPVMNTLCFKIRGVNYESPETD